MKRLLKKSDFLCKSISGDDIFWAESSEQADMLILNHPLFEASQTSPILSEFEFPLIRQRLFSFIRSNYYGGHVLLKTSTTGNRAAYHEVSPLLLWTIIKYTCETVSPKKVILADGPAFASYVEECKRLRWYDMVIQSGIRLLDLNKDEVSYVVNWPVSKTFVTADIIINVTKAKTHRRFGVSLGLKGLLGALSGEILGYPKLQGNHHVVPWLTLELEKQAPPILTIIDGREGVEGNGPLQGIMTDSSFISVGEGCFCPDIRACIEMGFDPILVPGLIGPCNYLLGEAQVNWSDLRTTARDFIPPIPCSWLYKSLTDNRRRGRNYNILLTEIRKCWPKRT